MTLMELGVVQRVQDWLISKMAVVTELGELARVLADWAAGCPGFWPIYLYGSRVRGDHRPDSDVDLRIFRENYKGDDLTLEWWVRETSSGHADLQRRLPGLLHLRIDSQGPVDA